MPLFASPQQSHTQVENSPRRSDVYDRLPLLTKKCALPICKGQLHQSSVRCRQAPTLWCCQTDRELFTTGAAYPHKGLSFVYGRLSKLSAIECITTLWWPFTSKLRKVQVNIKKQAWMLTDTILNSWAVLVRMTGFCKSKRRNNSKLLIAIVALIIIVVC